MSEKTTNMPERRGSADAIECCGHLRRRAFLTTAAFVAAGAVAATSSPGAAHANDALAPLLRGGGGNVEWFRLVPGFVAENTDAEGWPTKTAFDNGNPWGMYTAYLMAVNDKGHRTWRIEQYMPEQFLFGHEYAQGTTMYLLEGSALALLVDTGLPDPADHPAPARRVDGQDDLVTVVRHLLSHEDDGTARVAPAVDFVVANTHNHGDHTGKNAKMPERAIYYPALDWPSSDVPANYVPIVEGGGVTPAGTAVGSIDLGDRSIEAINVYGHTAGSMAYLDRENDVVATGDALGSGFVYVQGGPLTTYQQTVKHLLDVLSPYPDVAVLPAHSYQLRAWDRRLPPVSGRPSDREYIVDQLNAVTGVIDGTILIEPYIAAGRQTSWAKSNSAQVVLRLDTIYPGGPFGGNYGPDIWRVERIPGLTKTSPWIDSTSPISNIKTEFYLLRDSANTSVYLIKGSRRALLVGTGRGTQGLATIARRLAGGVPLDVVVTSLDPDQIGGTQQFGSQTFFVAKPAGLPKNLPAGVLKDILKRLPKNLQSLQKRVKLIEPGHVFDLGTDSAGRPARIEAIALTGHSEFGLTLLSVSDRILLSGDALGEQFGGGGLVLTVPPTEFDQAFREWRTTTDARYDTVYTAHNYTWFTSPAFVDKVQEALGVALAGGPTVPSVRPAGFPMVQSSGPNDVIASIILPT